MRPVEKANVGDILLYTAGELEIEFTIQNQYNPYSTAKEPLAINLGEYCSYCEVRKFDEALHVEHVQPKAPDKYPNLEFSWSNFLLSCQRCNGGDNKGVTDVILADIHLPHQNNTLLSIQYTTGGMVRIHPNLEKDSSEYTKAQKLIDLVGLNKRPGHEKYKPNDKRWNRRRIVWELATKYLQKWEDKTIEIDTIMDLAKSNGFFSVWFSVFENHPEIRKALVNAFSGTATNCFYSNYQPIPRNPPSI